jgi:dimethylamine monooxygenase subunit A
MDLILKSAETFRGDFSARNSDDAILRFPFPFPEDKYMYGVNIEPHVRGGATAAYDAIFDLDEHYIGECEDRALTLLDDPLRCQVLPHMAEAEWDTLELLMESLALDYPQHFSLIKNGAAWHWINRPLGLDQHFIFGRTETLPCPPFEYITRQVQGDFTLQDHRDNNLFMDGGMVTSQADWSLNFDLGMSFHEWHGPVPIAHELGVFDRALAYLLRLQYGKPVRRLNWTLTVNPRLDTSPENYPIWGPDKVTVTPENVGAKLCLRVELQTLTRLPRSNAILFGVRGYLIRLEELVRVRKWGRRLHRVLRDLPPEIADYKGMPRYRQMIVDYLAPFDDGAAISSGTAPEQSRLDL